ncbi:DUF1707 SHOCT-like domain-containing protein [Streptomyces xiaopingdaonensis]|uniref:DUF1707 SHOCT-like domain-containing protein n=1 Tax=Streptomyces xiaopingdaonensis TaxID=1565415 RepID=UPI0002EB4343|nr:DUF1707 domain-containing protein [Streptomyces xiaopingdaonensis]
MASSDDLTPRSSPAARELRAADTDREAVAERLREAAVEGRLSLTELEQRLEAAFSAKTFAELEPLVADLPDAPPRAGSSGRPLVLKTNGVLQQTGYWEVPETIVANTSMGTITIDFTAAECRRREVTIELAVGMGTVVVVVPRGWAVRIDEVSTGMSNVVNRVTGPPEPEAAVVHFTGRVRMGTLKVRHPSRFETARARRAGR